MHEHDCCRYRRDTKTLLHTRVRTIRTLPVVVVVVVIANRHHRPLRMILVGQARRTLLHRQGERVVPRRQLQEVIVMVMQRIRGRLKDLVRQVEAEVAVEGEVGEEEHLVGQQQHLHPGMAQIHRQVIPHRHRRLPLPREQRFRLLLHLLPLLVANVNHNLKGQPRRRLLINTAKCLHIDGRNHHTYLDKKKTNRGCEKLKLMKNLTN